MSLLAATDEINIAALSENALLLSWPEIICEQQHQQIIHCQQRIKSQFGELIIDTIASYNTLMVYYRFEQISLAQITTKLVAICQQLTASTAAESRTELVEIPVYYGEDAGWDLNLVAQQTQLSIAQVIERHSQTIYHAYALGFTPGFCYLGCLDKSLILPRKNSPRVAIPKGAVAIAEQQTAIYPSKSPGGWHIIGQTPMPMFAVNHETNSSQQGDNINFSPAINVGQQVKFTPIDYQRFCQLGGKLELEHAREPTNHTNQNGEQ